jgi:hypothetical protein
MRARSQSMLTYNIARKGLLLVDKVKNDKRAVLSNREWFEYLMAEE